MPYIYIVPYIYIYRPTFFMFLIPPKDSTRLQAVHVSSARKPPLLQLSTIPSTLAEVFLSQNQSIAWHQIWFIPYPVLVGSCMWGKPPWLNPDGPIISHIFGVDWRHATWHPIAASTTRTPWLAKASCPPLSWSSPPSPSLFLSLLGWMGQQRIWTGVRRYGETS